MNIEDDFRDLAPLDPSRDPARWERMVAGVMAAAGPELARRASLPQPGMLLLLADWMRPTVSAAALLAAAAAENVTIIDPYDWICAPSAKCPIVVGNTMVYRDYGHLADGFVEALTPVVEDELLRLFDADLSRRPEA